MARTGPSSARLLDSGILSRLARVPLQSRLPMAGSVSGIHRSATRGASVEFAEYRKYVPGDDVRQLDWQAYARSDRFYIKEFEADTNLRAHLVLDCSGSMGFASARGGRFEFARRLSAHLAYLLVQQGDAVGLHCARGEAAEDIPARQTPSHLQHIFTRLEDLEPSGPSSLIASLHLLAEKVPRRAQMLVISDALVPAQDLLDAFQHLRFRRHDIALFHLLAPEELAFSFERPVRFVDLEGGPDFVADPTLMREAYRVALDRHLDTLLRGCREFQIDYRRVMVDHDLEQVLAAFLLARGGRSPAKRTRR